MSARTVHKTLRDMLEVHSLRACDEWLHIYYSASHHSRRGKLFDGQRPFGVTLRIGGLLHGQTRMPVAWGDLSSPWDTS